MVGNGVTNWKYDTLPAFIEMAYWHGLYDDDLYNTVKGCDFSYQGFPNPPTPLNDTCTAALNRFGELTSQINGYDVFGKCWTTQDVMDMHETSSEVAFRRLNGKLEAYNKFYTAADYTPWAFNYKKNSKRLQEIPPCVYAGPIIPYLNDATVKSQLHIDPSAPAWDLCSNVNYTDNLNGSQPIYVSLKGKYKMLKYSGDTDGSVPTYGTLQWIRELGWTVTEAWRPYYVMDPNGAQQVAGYVEKRDGNFTFASIHGAGHMAPQWKRQYTYHAIFSFVKDQPF